MKRQLAAALDRFTEAWADMESLGNIVARLNGVLSAAFTAQGSAFEAAAGQAMPGAIVPPPANVFDSAIATATATETGTMADAIQLAATEAMEVAITGMGIGFDLTNPGVAAYLRDYGAARVSQISETTREAIKEIVQRGVADGKSYDEIAREIKERFKEFAVGRPQQHIDSRAHLVAVTEVGNAYEAGNLAAANETGQFFPMQKAWLTVGDDRVSDLCRGNQAAGWIDINAAFPSGHQRPLGHPACRCTALYRRKVV